MFKRGGLRAQRIALVTGVLATAAAGPMAIGVQGRYDDRALESSALSRLERRAELRELPIEVGVHYGVARLQGRVDTLQQAESARRVVAAVRGLVDLQSSLEVPAGLASDEDVQRGLERELERFPALRGLELQLGVEQGKATIAGEVRTAGERRLVLEGARRVPGLRAVDLRLQVREGRAAAESLVEDRVRGLLGDRLRFPIQGRVSVRVRDRIAILEGEVQRVIDRLDAEEVAWYVGGVLGVQNLIAVVPRPRLRPALVPRDDEGEGARARPPQADPETPEEDDQEDVDEED